MLWVIMKAGLTSHVLLSTHKGESRKKRKKNDINEIKCKVIIEREKSAASEK